MSASIEHPGPGIVAVATPGTSFASGSAATESSGANDLFPEVWAAINTRPRCEWKVLDALERMRVPAYMPSVVRRHHYAGRMRETTMPLFGSYLFYEYGHVDRIQVLRTYGVVRVIPTRDPQRLADELRSLSLALSVQAAVPKRVAIGPPGTPVEVFAGPFIGCRGVLIRQKKSSPYLLLQVGFLGFGAAIEIDEAVVRPLSILARDLAAETA